MQKQVQFLNREFRSELDNVLEIRFNENRQVKVLYGGGESVIFRLTERQFHRLKEFE